MQVEVGGADAASLQDVVAAISGGHLTPGLGDQQETRRQVPGAEVALPEAVHPPRSHPGQVQGCRAKPANAGDTLADLVQFLQEPGVLAVAHDDARLILARDPDLKSLRGEALRTLLYLFGRDEAVRYLRAG